MIQTWRKIGGTQWVRGPYAPIPISGRDSLGEPGTYKPDASTTGVVSGSVLAVHNGDFNTTANNQVVENLDITGRVNIKHNYVTIRNCNIRNTFAPVYSPDNNDTDIWGAINARALGSTYVRGCLVQDCTITAVSPNVNCYGVVGRDVTVLRCDISKVVDALHLHEDNCYVLSSYIHDMRYYALDARQDPGDGSHNDGVQWGGGTTLQIIGNSFEFPAIKGSAGLGLYASHWPGKKIVVDRNWIIAAPATAPNIFSMALTVTGKTLASVTDISITDNRFSPGSTWLYGYPVLLQDATYNAIIGTPKLSGNVYDVSGAAIPIKHSAQP